MPKRRIFPSLFRRVREDDRRIIPSRIIIGEGYISKSITRTGDTVITCYDSCDIPALRTALETIHELQKSAPRRVQVVFAGGESRPSGPSREAYIARNVDTVERALTTILEFDLMAQFVHLSSALLYDVDNYSLYHMSKTRAETLTRRNGGVNLRLGTVFGAEHNRAASRRTISSRIKESKRTGTKIEIYKGWVRPYLYVGNMNIYLDHVMNRDFFAETFYLGTNVGISAELIARSAAINYELTSTYSSPSGKGIIYPTPLQCDGLSSNDPRDFFLETNDASPL